MSLPSGYKRLEYIQSDGNQWIDSGIVPGSSDFSVKSKIRTTAATSAENWFVTIGHSKPSGSATFAQFGTWSSKFVIHLTGIVVDGSTAAISDDVTIDFSISGNTASLSGDASYSVTNANFGSGSFRNQSITICDGLWRTYWSQIKVGGSLVRDYIPCQTTSGEIGLWDDANSVFYGNAGTGTFTAGPVVDPYGNDKNTLLLLHGEDLEDSSPYGIAITNNGVSVSNNQSKFGGKSLYFNGVSKLTLSGSSFNFGTDDFTIDAWVYPESISNDNFFFSGDNSGSFFFGRTGGNNSIGIGRAGIAWDITFACSLTVNSWNHIALVKSSGTFYLFINGVLKSTKVSSISYGMANGTVSIGAQGSNYYFKGYLDEFRVSDIARWTEDFTPPSKPYSSSLNLPVNIGGTWKDANEAFVNIGGTWKTVKAAFVNIDGTWKELS